MTFGSFDAEQFRRQLTNYTEAELIKLGRSCSSAASRWLEIPWRNRSMRRSTNCAGRNIGEGIRRPCHPFPRDRQLLCRTV